MCIKAFSMYASNYVFWVLESHVISKEGGHLWKLGVEILRNNETNECDEGIRFAENSGILGYISEKSPHRVLVKF
jgi:hypothetical protein